LTLTQFGVIVGIATALATFGLNAYFGWSKRKEEEQEHQARMALLERETQEHGG
jgi:hypothetical protein